MRCKSNRESFWKETRRNLIIFVNEGEIYENSKFEIRRTRTAVKPTNHNNEFQENVVK